jgi:allantoinase
LYREGENEARMMSLGVHLRIIGRPGRFVWFERFIDHVLSKGDVWITTRRSIAEHWTEHCPYNVEET